MAEPKLHRCPKGHEFLYIEPVVFHYAHGKRENGGVAQEWKPLPPFCWICFGDWLARQFPIYRVE